jgi:hypothetical protein
MNELLQPMPGYQLLGFLLLPVIIIAVCILTGASLRALVPKAYSLMTGGRGL